MLKNLSPTAYANLVTTVVVICIIGMFALATYIVRTSTPVEQPVETVETVVEPSVEPSVEAEIQRLRASESTADNISADLIQEFVRDADGDGKLDYTLERDPDGTLVIQYNK